MHSLEPVPLAAGAGEDRAALSGRPRKANADQYESVLQQARRRDVTLFKPLRASFLPRHPW